MKLPARKTVNNGGNNMATTTENLELIKIEASDGFSIDHFNDNMDTLDGFAATAAAEHTTISDEVSQVGETADSIEGKVDTVNGKVDSVSGKVDTLTTKTNTISTTANTISSKIGTSGDTGKTTLFGKLNNISSSAIKSLQRVTCTANNSKTDYVLTINAVNPEKCIVILERLKTNYNIPYNVDYALTATALTAYTMPNTNSQTATLGFWIVEFN